ncbi:hypothetical protein VOLCADRAFT_101316, partial [Volvox carteri f. nagariensis]
HHPAATKTAATKKKPAAAAPPTTASPPDDDGLPSKSEVLSFVRALWDKAQAMLEKDLAAAGPDGPVTYSTAVLLMHALLAEMISGVYIPPVRLSVLSTLMVSGMQTCKQQDCFQMDCRGNNLVEVIPVARAGAGADGSHGASSSSRSSSSRGRRLVMETIHHKTERFKKDEALRIVLPSTLSQHIRTYTEYARPALLNMNPSIDDASKEPPFLFLDRKGRPVAGVDAPFTDEWKLIQRKYGAPWPTVFCPMKFRHLHATVRFKDLVDNVADQEEEALAGDALVMGNSVAVWRRHYIKGRDSIVAQKAVGQLGRWRAMERQKQH